MSVWLERQDYQKRNTSILYGKPFDTEFLDLALICYVLNPYFNMRGLKID